MARDSKRKRETQTGNDARESGLLRRVADRDYEALAELYRIYHARLFNFIFRLTRSYSAADELVNDTMLVVWKNARDFRAHSRVSTWIFGIAYRKAVRRLGRRTLHPAPEAAEAQAATDDGAAAETEDWVRQGIDALPPAQRVTVLLVFYLGLSYPEVAEVTGCPVNTVKSRMFHARRKLRDLLARPECVGPSSGRSGHEHATD